MRKGVGLSILTGWLLSTLLVEAQRVYSPSSVLASGKWYKISVNTEGIYRIDLAFLTSLGINTANLASSSIRLFGNGGHMLPEANSVPRPDDLLENSIQVVDGGDGLFNGNDYLLFYANGPDRWVKDSINQRFIHVKNLYSDKSFYFLTIEGNGKRIPTAPLPGNAITSTNSFSERFFHELDTVNFLAGSKEWYGEELSSLPGRSLSKNFIINNGELVPGSTVILNSNLISRSAGVAGRFDIRVNGTIVGQPLINAVGTGQYDQVANSVTQLSTASLSQPEININYTYVPGSMNSQGWINWFELFTRKKLKFDSRSQLLFRDWLTVGNTVTEFVIENSSAVTQVWDITDPVNPVKIQGQFNNGEFRFRNSSLKLHEYIAFKETEFLIPVSVGPVANQNLHQTSPADFIIISHPAFMNQANRLANIHRNLHSLRSVVVSTEQVFNEFSSGSPDPVALRDFAKMYFDKYFQSVNDRPRYLLLFGDASYDYKNRIANNTNFVPCWQNSFSLDPLSSFTSDDFFGFLDDQEDINSGLVNNLLDVGIGRIPAKNIFEAVSYIDKVESYVSAKGFGPWRNQLTFVADDEDNNLHLQDAEILSSTSKNTAPDLNQQKIYLDAYKQESGAGGSHYPQAVQASNSQIFNGTLIWNYNGHGGAKRLAEETILDQKMVDQWSNSTRLPLFITGTCDFAPYDNPGIASLGENILLREKTGAIALMTTTRVVFAFSNRVMNDNYLRFQLERDANGKFRALGDAVKDAKNFTYQTSPDITNNRKFSLLGDPALTPAFPFFNISVTRINGLNAGTTDTLSSGEEVMIEGEVNDLQGAVLNSFNGHVYPLIYDKPQTVQTLANDPGSSPAPFQLQQNILFKGKASVANGRFSFRFKVPKDIQYQVGNGKISLYATDSITDANGYFTNFLIGGTGSNNSNDKEGPQMKIFLNDETFANGGLSNVNPVLILKLKDSSGINTAGTGIGHDLVATLDNDNKQFFILNDFYEADLNSFQSGTVRYQLPALPPGPHCLKIKAWDVLNNSSEATLDFLVANDEQLELSHVLNYPNPFTSHTSFWFEHNKPGQRLHVQLQIMTITGRIVRSFSTDITTTGNRSEELSWDGKDETGSKVGRGVYIYELKVRMPGQRIKTRLGKLVKL